MNLHDEDGVDVVVGAVGMAVDTRIGMNGGLMIVGVGVRMGAGGEIEAEAGPHHGEAEALPVKVQLSAEPKLNSGIVSEKSVKLLKMCQLAPPGLQQEILRLIMTNRAESLVCVSKPLSSLSGQFPVYRSLSSFTLQATTP